MEESRRQVNAAEVLAALAASGEEPVDFSECDILSDVKIEEGNFERDDDGRYVVSRDVDFAGARFFGAVSFAAAHFVGTVDFGDVSFDRGVDFTAVRFARAADFTDARFEEEADFVGAHFGAVAHFSGAQFLGPVDFLGARFDGSAYFLGAEFHVSLSLLLSATEKRFFFGGVRYWPDTLGQRFRPWLLSSERSFERLFWRAPTAEDRDGAPRSFTRAFLLPRRNCPRGRPKRPTAFHLASDEIDDVTNPRFKRYVADHLFLRAFEEEHPGIAFLWRWSSDYGRKFWLWALWCLLIVVAFAGIYSLPGFAFALTGSGDGVPDVWSRLDHSLSVFTMLGFDGVRPANVASRLAVLVERFVGFVMLGLLLGMGLDRIARRS